MDHRNYLFVASSHPVTQIVLVEMSDSVAKCRVLPPMRKRRMFLGELERPNCQNCHKDCMFDAELSKRKRLLGIGKV
jgi:hypothetical protein